MSEEIRKLERKIYLKYLAGIFAGIIPVLIFWKKSGTPAAVLTIGGGIVIIISFIGLSATFDMFYKIKGRLREQETGEPFRETYIDWPPWLQKWGGLLYFIIVLTGIKFFASQHENDFGGTKFVWHSVIAGVLLGIILFGILKLVYTSWTSSKNKSAEIAFYFILASVFLTVSAGPPVNKYFADSKIECKQYPLKDRGRNYKSDKGYIHLITGKGSERFEPPRSFFNQLSEKDSLVILCTRKGALGYEYVHAFRKHSCQFRVLYEFETGYSLKRSG